MKKKSPASAEPPRDVIYADLDDEVTTLFERVRRARRKHVALVIPARAPVLGSLVNLKILRFKSENAGKVLTIVTKDTAGRRLALEVGLAAAERVKVRGKQIKLEALSAAAPFSATPNPTTTTGKPTRLGGRRLTITAAVGDLKAKLRVLARDEIPLGQFNPATRARAIWQRLAGSVIAEETETAGGASHLVVRTPSRRALFGLITAAVLLLFFIVYVAAPTATIYISPRVDVISKTINVTLTDSVQPTGPVGRVGAHLISSEFLEFNFSRDIRIGATGQIFSGTNAEGTVIVYNRSPKAKFIVPSRFQSKDGLIFHTTKVLTIPRAVGGTPGSIETTVVACVRDDTSCDCINEADTCEGDFVGARGNITPSFFTLPAIPSLSPSLYWAESIDPFTGGTTDITKYISEVDLTQIAETITIEVASLAREELTAILDQKNRISGTNLTLLEGRGAIDVEIITFAVPPDLLNSQQDDFTVSVTARVMGAAYESDDLRALLYEQLETKVHPEKVLTKVDFEGLVYRIDDLQLDSGYAKLAVTVEGVEEYDLSELTDTGARFVEKIRSRILGKNTSEAEAYIRNLPEINNASISSWPFWSRTIPELTENVKFKIRN